MSMTRSATPSSGTASLVPVSRRARVVTPSARSRGPSSRRIGTPLSSHSTARRPKEVSVRSSSLLRTPARISRWSRSRQTSMTSSLTAMTTTWRGAMTGGRRRPASSPWDMISAPMVRVDMPQDVVQACCTVLSASLKVMSKPLAKFWPRLWLVAICRALPSRMRPSWV